VAKDNRTTSLPRPRARNLEVESVCSPAHSWDLKLPAHAVAKPRTRGASVNVIARMMAEGEWYTGRSASMLARAWGTTAGNVQNIAAEASRVVKGVIDGDALRRTINESVERLMENGYAAREDDNINGSTIAFTKAAELCAKMLDSSVEKDPKKQTEQDAFKRLVELGWAPPKVMLGLPKPDLMDPEKDE